MKKIEKEVFSSDSNFILGIGTGISNKEFQKVEDRKYEKGEFEFSSPDSSIRNFQLDKYAR